MRPRYGGGSKTAFFAAVQVWCRTGASGDFDLSGNQVSEILTSPGFLQRVERFMPGRLAEAQLVVQALQEDSQD